jgi:hypothetical protein
VRGDGHPLIGPHAQIARRSEIAFGQSKPREGIESEHRNVRFGPRSGRLEDGRETIT